MAVVRCCSASMVRIIACSAEVSAAEAGAAAIEAARNANTIRDLIGAD
jgi:hypothetical protein